VVGRRPIAILAYGIDLGKIVDHFTWDYDEHDVQTGGPSWYNQGADNDFASAATAALHAARGITPADHESLNVTEQPAAEENLDVRVVRYGSMTGDEELTLAAKVHMTDWDETIPIGRDDLPTDADDKLTWALNVLGITPENPEPRWLLAAHFQ
jgi:hypothetical protein